MSLRPPRMETPHNHFSGDLNQPFWRKKMGESCLPSNTSLQRAWYEGQDIVDTVSGHRQRGAELSMMARGDQQHLRAKS